MNLTTGANSAISRAGAVLIHGLALWHEKPTAAKNYTYSNAIVKHCLRRQGFYNEISQYLPKVHSGLSFNALPSDSEAWSFSCDSGDSSAFPAVLVRLTHTTPYCCVSTFHEESNHEENIAGEFQKIQLPEAFSPQRKGRKLQNSTIYMKMIPLCRLNEIEDDTRSPLLGCVLGIPRDNNANLISGAALYSTR